MTKRTRVKIQRCHAWRPTSLRAERWWINLPDGGYFAIFKGSTNWHHMYAQHSEFKSMEEAIVDGLACHCYKHDGGPRRYRRIRVKERTFQFS